MLDQFLECFSDKPGLCNLLTHEINVKPEVKPRQFKAYRVHEILKGEIDRRIDELLNQCFIKPSKILMVSPLVFVLKENKSARLTCDFRCVNKYSVHDGFPMQNIDEVKIKVGNSNLISVFDDKSGYWQIRVREEYQWLSAFSTHDSLYEWTRVPFGMKNSGTTFVGAIQMIRQPIKCITERMT